MITSTYIYNCFMLHFTGKDFWALYKYIDKIDKKDIKWYVTNDGTHIKEEPDINLRLDEESQNFFDEIYKISDQFSPFLQKRT